MTNVIRQRSFTKGSYLYTVSRIWEADADIQYLYNRKSDLQRSPSMEDQRDYAEAIKRIKAFEDFQWSLIGIQVDITLISVPDPLFIGSAYRGGFESDSGESYLMYQEDATVRDAEANVEAVRTALRVRVA